MYTHRVTWYPAAGKTRELRGVLEELVRHDQAEGRRIALLRSMYGEVLYFVTAIAFENLAAREAWQASPETLGIVERGTALVSRPNALSLREELVPRKPTPNPPPRKYITSFNQYPIPGKGPEVRALMIERVEREQAAGGRSQLLSEFMGPDAGAFINQRVYESLAEYEEERSRRQADEWMRGAGIRLSSLVTRRNSSEMFEILIARPPAAA